ncbi:glycosyltransferase family 2 protein [Desulfonatronum parangueonense]
MDYAVICAIARDEENFIIDWLDFHFAIGFEKVYLFDNNSKIPLAGLLAEYIDLQLVQVFEINDIEYPQLTAYASFIKEYSKIAKWICFIDIDEYIVLKKTKDVKVLLENYELYAALGVSWKIFGSSGHISRPKESVFYSYTNVVSNHNLIKSIVCGEKVKSVSSPHHFLYKNDHYCVNEHYIPIIGPRSYHSTEYVQLNHYYYKSQQDFESKISRGYATPIKNSKGYDINIFYRQVNNFGYEDFSIRKFMNIYKKFSCEGPKFIQEKIESVKNVKSDDIMRRIEKKISFGDTKGAISIINESLRYKKDPFLYFALTRIYASEGEFEKSFLTIQKVMIYFNNFPEIVKLAYQQLIHVYNCMGLKEQQRSIVDQIGT